ncbi:gag-pol fusion protein [Rhizophagus irregularis DAOM 197198w]|uniref:Gag-pol fusion protein n=1 Tax=Rhizophagus irregularis (strain DAOM 197198w) TaxID=1432141 RepID=A0A015LB39_RHIIW|nr:gag-pol fusion protein [Rhizophagus irregularis DAOM 197198w]
MPTLTNHPKRIEQKTHLEYEQITKEVEYYHTEIGSEVETTPTTVKMKIGVLPTDLELPLLRFLAVRKHWYRTSKNERNFIEEEIQRMLQEGLIERSTGPWAAPVVLVRKKNRKLRFCVDYRELNSITMKDAYPLPRIDDMLNSFGKAQWFTSLNLASEYWQVEMDPADRPKTAFIIQFGTYQFKVMPFGLYDVIIYSDTFEQHLEHLRVIFDRLEDAGLKLNPDKCSFVKEELEFLGHIVSNRGIRTDPAKIQKVKDFPTPLNVTQLRGFFGLASYYRRFVPGFSRIATPLNKLLKKGVAYNWGEKQQVAFEQLKQTLITSPILVFPDFNKQFILLTDASTFGLGVILSQLDEDGNDRVIAYASRTCNKAESNYSATELECLAVIWAVKHFHAYIYGQRFKLVTDHEALCHLFNMATPIGRLAHWVMKLQMYDFETTHRFGRKHLNVDSLSRIRI